MEFPTTPVLDDFNAGALQNLTSRTGWGTTPFISSEATLTTDAAPTYAIGAAGAWRSNWWSWTLSDCEVWVVIDTAATGRVPLWTRCSNVNTTTTSGYNLDWAISGRWDLFTQTVGVASASLVGGTQALSNGDAVGLRSIGTTHEIWYKLSGGSWRALGSVVESAFASGVLALETNGLSRIGSFGGGEAVGLAGVNFERQGDRRA